MVRYINPRQNEPGGSGRVAPDAAIRGISRADYERGYRLARQKAKTLAPMPEAVRGWYLAMPEALRDHWRYAARVPVPLQGHTWHSRHVWLMERRRTIQNAQTVAGRTGRHWHEVARRNIRTWLD